MIPVGLLASPKTWAAIAIIGFVVAVGAYVGIQKVEISSLKKEVATLTEERNNLTVDNKVLKENNTTLKDGLKKLAVANQTNFDTAKQLLEERGKATQAIANLAAANRVSNQKLDRLSVKIEEMLKDPKNDGPVAPVLREVLREIQKERTK